MELEGDDPAPRPPEPSGQVATQSLRVTPENVVAMAKTFQDCADRLAGELRHMRHDMNLTEPWLHDPVSEWARVRFDEYFVHSAHAFVRIVQSEFEQHQAITSMLVATGQLYGLTEELIAAGFTDLEQDR